MSLEREVGYVWAQEALDSLLFMVDSFVYNIVYNKGEIEHSSCCVESKLLRSVTGSVLH